MVAAIGRSASYPTAQWETARNLATRFDVPVIEIETHELAVPNYLANSPNRCFYCKTELWSRLVPEARARGFAVVCDGTNADDLHEHRPGRAAGLAAGIRSPLAEAGFTKSAVREAARALGLPIWDAPAAPCLSSRVQYGLMVTPARLRQGEEGEAYLRALGVTGDLRGRHFGDAARIEGEPRWIPRLQARSRDAAGRPADPGLSRGRIAPPGHPPGSPL